jgi:hypothetical protein
MQEKSLSARNLPLWPALWAMMVLGGCATSAEMTAANLGDVKPGMAREEVLAMIGPAQREERYGSIEFLIYSTDGTSTIALLNFTPIAIVDGRVTGTGRQLYDAVVQAHASGEPRR